MDWAEGLSQTIAHLKRYRGMWPSVFVKVAAEPHQQPNGGYKLLAANFEGSFIPLTSRLTRRQDRPIVLDGACSVDEFQSFLEQWAETRKGILGTWELIAVESFSSPFVFPNALEDPAIYPLVGAALRHQTTYRVFRFTASGSNQDLNYNELLSWVAPPGGGGLTDWARQTLSLQWQGQNPFLHLQLPLGVTAEAAYDEGSLQIRTSVWYRPPLSPKELEIRTGRGAWDLSLRARKPIQAGGPSAQGWYQADATQTVDSPGRYTVWISRSGSPDSADWAIQVDVPAPQPSRVVTRLEPAGEIRWPILSDEAISGPDEDVLERADFARWLADSITDFRSETKSCVFAIIGPWGSGKSSVISLLGRELEQRKWRVVNFNPWEYSDVATITQGFFRSVREALPTDGKRSQLREALARYGATIVPYAEAINVPVLPFFDIGRLGKAVVRSLKDDETTATLRRKVEDQLQSLDHPVLVAIDDVDRLHPDELLVLFKLVRLIGRLTNVYYVLAYDETTLIDLLSKTALAPAGSLRPQAYMEKIIQVRFELPALRESRTRQLFSAALGEVITRQGLTLSEPESTRVTDAYFRVLRTRLDEPRAIKRFFAQVQAYGSHLLGYVNFVDFLNMTYIRTFYPSVFRQLRQSRERLVGAGGADRRDVPQVDADKELAHWTHRLRDTGVPEEETEGLIWLLSDLFPLIRPLVQLPPATTVELRELARDKRAGSREHFDVYFYFGPEVGQAPLGSLDDAFASLEAGSLPEGIALLRLLVTQRGPEAIPDILARVEDAALLVQLAVSQIVAEHYMDLSSEGILGLSPRRQADFLMAQVLTSDLADDDIQQRIEEMLRSPDGWRLFVAGVDLAWRSNEEKRLAPSTRLAWMRSRALEVLQDRLAYLSGRQLESVADGLMAMIGSWERLGSPEDVRQWLVTKLDTTAWTTHDFLGLFTPVGTEYSDGSRRKVLGSFMVSEFDELVGVENALSRISDLELSSADSPAPGETSFQSRIAAGLVYLRSRTKPDDE